MHCPVMKWNICNKKFDRGWKLQTVSDRGSNNNFQCVLTFGCLSLHLHVFIFHQTNVLNSKRFLISNGSQKDVGNTYCIFETARFIFSKNIARCGHLFHCKLLKSHCCALNLEFSRRPRCDWAFLLYERPPGVFFPRVFFSTFAKLNCRTKS